MKQAHKEVWARVAFKLETKCEFFKSYLTRDGFCLYCNRTSYSRRSKQCNVTFQSAVVGIIIAMTTQENPDSVFQHLLTGLAAQAAAPNRSTGSNQTKKNRTRAHADVGPATTNAKA